MTFNELYELLGDVNKRYRDWPVVFDTSSMDKGEVTVIAIVEISTVLVIIPTSEQRKFNETYRP